MQHSNEHISKTQASTFKIALCILTVSLVLIICGTYCAVNRYVVTLNDKLLYVYDKFNRKVEIYNSKGRIFSTTSDENAKYNYNTKKVYIIPQYDAEQCPEKSPLRITITNSSEDTLLVSKFFVDVRYNNKSSSLLDGKITAKRELPQRYEFDTILEQGKTASLCYKMPNTSEQFNKETMRIDPFSIENTFKNIQGGDVLTQIRF